MRRGGPAGASSQAAGSGAPLSQRSFLGHALPESLLWVLEAHGPAAFAEALAGDHDTPELVWTSGMRAQRLVPQVRGEGGGGRGGGG